MIKQSILGICIAFSSTSSPVGASAFELWAPLEVTETILRDPGVVEFFHVDAPGRQPVYVLSTLSHPSLQALRLGYELKVIEAGSPEALNAFRFTRVDVSADKATIEFAYPPEGMHGRFLFVRQAGAWKLKSRRLWER